MAGQPQAMLAELSETAATGRIAEIYHEIRRYAGVPYVSSLQRYLATLPGVLEWAWDTLRPAMISGAIAETGWRLAKTVALPPAGPVAPATIRDWGLTDPDLAAIRNIAANFVRVSPVNLVTGACLAQLLQGARPSGPGFQNSWTPPAMLPAMPGNLAPEQLPPSQRAVLLRFATHVDGTPFIPALYRQLAHWPPLLAWLADALAPRFAAPETAIARTHFRAAARGAAREIVAILPAPPHPPDPETIPQETRRRVLGAIDRYAETSPEMTMFGQLLLDALPPTDP